MICEIQLSTLAISKFSEIALKTLLAGALSVSPEDIGTSARWAEGEIPPAIPEVVRIEVPDGTGYTCQQMGVYLRNNYDPQKDDGELGQEESARKADLRLKAVQAYKDLKAKQEELENRIEALEAQ
jgi:hypothetical protein